MPPPPIQENAFENVVCEMASIRLGLNVLRDDSTYKQLYEQIYLHTMTVASNATHRDK